MEKTFHPGKNVICLSCSALSLAQRYGSVPTKNWDIIPLLLSYFLFLRDTNFPYWWGARRTHYIFKSQIIIPCTGENGDKLFMLAILITCIHVCAHMLHQFRLSTIQTVRVRWELSSVKQRPQISVTRQSWLEVVETIAKGCFSMQGVRDAPSKIFF